MFEVGEQRFGGKFTQFHSAVIPQLGLVTFVSHIAQIIKLQWQIGIWAMWLTHKSEPGLAFQTTSFLYSYFFYVLLTTDGIYSSFSHLFYHFIYITNLFFLWFQHPNELSTLQFICWYCENQWTSKIDSTSDLPSPQRIFHLKLYFLVLSTKCAALSLWICVIRY